MKSEQPAITYENTLLIVESSTIAEIINRFDLPYITTLATDGFCWKPLYNRDKQSITLKAVRGKRDIRNRIRDQSRWASRVIIATDPDAAGDVIAYGIAKKLNRYSIDLYRTTLTALSRRAFQKAVYAATPISTQTLTKRLVNRYKLADQLREIMWPHPSKFNHAILALLSILFNRKEFTAFVDRQGNTFTSSKAMSIRYDKRIQGIFYEHQQHHYQPFPLSTADSLAAIKDSLSYSSYKHAQYDLNQLFTKIPDNLEGGIISYPRTKARGLFESTWNQIEQEWVKSKEMESLLPRKIRPMLRDSEPHEAIHPVRLDHTPSTIRPFIRKKYYDIYRQLFDRHVETLKRPEIYTTSVFRSQPSRTFFYPKDNLDDTSQKRKDLYPFLTLANLENRLMDHKALRPSRVGEFADYVLEQGLTKLEDDKSVRPGPTLHHLKNNIEDWSALNEFLEYVEKHLDYTIETHMISTYLKTILKDRVFLQSD